MLAEPPAQTFGAEVGSGVHWLLTKLGVSLWDHTREARRTNGYKAIGVELGMAEVPRKRLLKKPVKKLTKEVSTPKTEPTTKPTTRKPVNNLPSKRHDWHKARTLFVERMDGASLRDVALAVGINYDVLRQKAADERWTTLRAEWQSRVAVEDQKARIKKLVSEGQNFDDQVLQAAKIGATLIAGRLAQISQLFAAQQQGFANAISRMKQGLPVAKEELYGAFYAKDMSEFARSLQLFQQAGKLAIGIDTSNINVQELLNQAAGDDSDDVSITEELSKPDEDRLAAFLEGVERTGLLEKLMKGDIVDAEIIDVSTVTEAVPTASEQTGETPEQTPQTTTAP